MALPFTVPASLSPTFVISHCEKSDSDRMGPVYYDAFRTDPGNSFWWSPSRDRMMEWMHRRITKKMSDRGIRHFKVTDVQSGDMVAFARWDIPEGSAHFGEWIGTEAGVSDVSSLVNSDQGPTGGQGQSQEISVSAPAIESSVKPVVDAPEGADPELCRNFFDAIAGASKKWYTNDMLGLSLICTDPKYHRRGAAKALLVPMLDLADAQGLKTYLEATPAGKPVYEKLGFRVVDTLDFDLGKLTKHLDGLYQLSIMIREPKLTR